LIIGFLISGVIALMFRAFQAREPPVTVESSVVQPQNVTVENPP
jgi:hypothetical protein